MPRLIAFLRSPFRCRPGRCNPTIDPIHVSDVVECLIAAAASTRTVGQAYNIAPQREIKLDTFLAAICDVIGAKMPSLVLPRRLLFAIAAVLEGAGRLVRSTKPPLATRAGLSLFTNDRHHDSGKADREFGWNSRVALEDGVQFLAAEKS